MAGGKLKGTVQASTLIEVIISMIVIMVVFDIAMMIYVNITRFSVSVKSLHAKALLYQHLAVVEQNKDFVNETLVIDSVRIEQTVSAEDTLANNVTISLGAYDLNNQKIAGLQKIILNY